MDQLDRRAVGQQAAAQSRDWDLRPGRQTQARENEKAEEVLRLIPRKKRRPFPGRAEGEPGRSGDRETESDAGEEYETAHVGERANPRPSLDVASHSVSRAALRLKGHCRVVSSNDRRGHALQKPHAADDPEHQEGGENDNPEEAGVVSTYAVLIPSKKPFHGPRSKPFRSTDKRAMNPRRGRSAKPWPGI